MVKCKTMKCNRAVTGNMNYCDNCYMEWRVMPHNRETWHPDMVVEELRITNALLQEIKAMLEQKG